MPSRRSALYALGTGLVGLAGCTDRDPGVTETTTRPTTDTPASKTRSDTPYGDTPSETPEPDTGIRVDGAELAWERSLGGRIDTGPLPFGDSLVVAAGGRLYWLDTETGETRQRLIPGVVPDDRGRPDSTLQVHDGRLYAMLGINFGTGGRDYQVYAIDPAGEVRWDLNTGIGGFHTLLGVDDGAVTLATSDDAIAAEPQHAVVALETGTGDRRWQTESGDAMGGAVGDGRVVVETYGAADGFDLATGDQQFRVTPDDTDIAGSAAGDGLAFVGFERFDAPTGVSSIVALDSAGERRWEAALGFVNSLRYESDLFVGGEQLTRLAPDGSVRWTYERPAILTGVPFDDRAVYTNSESSVVAVSRDDGSELWASEASDVAIPRARGGEQVIAVDGGERRWLAYDARDGSERWTASATGEYLPDPAADATGAYLVTVEGGVAKVTE